MKYLDILRAATASCALATALFAQETSLRTDVAVQSLQQANLTAHVSGLPGNLAFLLAGVHTPNGVQTPYGTLYLNQASLVVVGAAILDNNGTAAFHVPFSPALHGGLSMGFQAFTIGPNQHVAASNADVVLVEADPALRWAFVCVIDAQGCVSVDLAGVAGTRIQVQHTDGTRAGTTTMWSATIPNPPRAVRTPGRIYPPSWVRGESIVIKIDGVEKLRITKR